MAEQVLESMRSSLAVSRNVSMPRRPSRSSQRFPLAPGKGGLLEERGIRVKTPREAIEDLEFHPSSGMRNKNKSGTAAGALHGSVENPHCLEGETLMLLLKSIQREIQHARAADASLPMKFWIKQQFAVGVNEVTRALERMPPIHGMTCISSEEDRLKNGDDRRKAPSMQLQVFCCSEEKRFVVKIFGRKSNHLAIISVFFAVIRAILLASDCNPRWLIKHLPALAASRNVPLIFLKDRKEGSLRLGELVQLKTAIAIGIKDKGNAVNQVIKEVLVVDKIDSIVA